MQASHVVEAAKKAPVKTAKKAAAKATKAVKKTASKAKASSGASFWYGADRPGYLGECTTPWQAQKHCLRSKGRPIISKSLFDEQ